MSINHRTFAEKTETLADRLADRYIEQLSSWNESRSDNFLFPRIEWLAQQPEIQISLCINAKTTSHGVIWEKVGAVAKATVHLRLMNQAELRAKVKRIRSKQDAESKPATPTNSKERPHYCWNKRSMAFWNGEAFNGKCDGSDAVPVGDSELAAIFTTYPDVEYANHKPSHCAY